jgi:DNA-binding MarR family transcriptional regulator
MSLELLKLENAIEEFRKLQADGKYATDLQPQAILILSMIARGHQAAEASMDQRAKNDCYVTVSIIKDKLRLSSAAASRNVAALCDKSPRKSKEDPVTGEKIKGDGYKLVKKIDNPRNETSKLLMLTDDGLQFVRNLERILRVRDLDQLEDRIKIKSIVIDSREGTDPNTKLKSGRKKEILEALNYHRTHGANQEELISMCEALLKSEGLSEKEIKRNTAKFVSVDIFLKDQ